MLRKFNHMPGRVSALAMGAVFGGVLFIGQGTAHAAGPSTATLEAEIRQLQSQLQQLQARQDFSQAQASQAQATANAAVTAAKTSTTANANKGGHVVITPGNRPGFESTDGRTAIYLTTRLHYDLGEYLNVHPTGTASPKSSLESGGNARRARIGVLGKFLGDWNYSLIYDFGGSSDGATSGANGIENAFVSYTGLHPFSIDLGYMDVPWTLDESISSNDIMFMERSSIQTIVTGLVAGDNRAAFGFHGNTDRAWGGVYFTGPQSNAVHTGANQQQVAAVGRASYQVLQNNDYNVHIGGDLGYLINRGTNATLSVADRPELRIDTTTFIGVDSIGGLPVKNAFIAGPEVAGGFGSFYAQAEYYHIGVDQFSTAGLNGGHTPHLSFDGAYLQGSYTLTGEHRAYAPGAGAYTGITPAHPFSFSGGGYGAWEVAARVSWADMDSKFASGLARTATGGYEGGKQTAFAVGLNWYVNQNVRFMWDYEHVLINNHPDAAGAASLPSSGEHIDWIGMRTQVAF